MKFLNRQKQQTCVPFYCPKILTKSYIEQSIFSYQLVCTNMGAYIWGQLKQTTSNQSPGPTKFQAFKTFFASRDQKHKFGYLSHSWNQWRVVHLKQYLLISLDLSPRKLKMFFLGHIIVFVNGSLK